MLELSANQSSVDQADFDRQCLFPFPLLFTFSGKWAECEGKEEAL